METILEKEKMDSMRALADTNIKVSEARVVLSNIKEAESKYLAERELKALSIVDRVLADSAAILAEAKGNYGQATLLYRSASELSDFLIKEYASFKTLIAEFDERNKVWDEAAGKRQAAMDELRTQISADRVRIKNDAEGLEAAKLEVEKDKAKIRDDRGTLDRAIIRLKNNRI